MDSKARQFPPTRYGCTQNTHTHGTHAHTNNNPQPCFFLLLLLNFYFSCVQNFLCLICMCVLPVVIVVASLPSSPPVWKPCAHPTTDHTLHHASLNMYKTMNYSISYDPAGCRLCVMRLVQYAACRTAQSQHSTCHLDVIELYQSCTKTYVACGIVSSVPLAPAVALVRYLVCRRFWGGIFCHLPSRIPFFVVRVVRVPFLPSPPLFFCHPAR